MGYFSGRTDFRKLHGDLAIIIVAWQLWGSCHRIGFAGSLYGVHVFAWDVCQC